MLRHEMLRKVEDLWVWQERSHCREEGGGHSTTKRRKRKGGEKTKQGGLFNRGTDQPGDGKWRGKRHFALGMWGTMSPRRKGSLKKRTRVGRRRAEEFVLQGGKKKKRRSDEVKGKDLERKRTSKLALCKEEKNT